jgi:hypothetical protein
VAKTIRNFSNEFHNFLDFSKWLCDFWDNFVDVIGVTTFNSNTQSLFVLLDFKHEWDFLYDLFLVLNQKVWNLALSVTESNLSQFGKVNAQFYSADQWNILLGCLPSHLLKLLNLREWKSLINSYFSSKIFKLFSELLNNCELSLRWKSKHLYAPFFINNAKIFQIQVFNHNCC